jgi:hypothetical protein
LGGGGDEKEDETKRGSRSIARNVATASSLLPRCCSSPAKKWRKSPLPPLLFPLLSLLLLLFSYLNCLLRTKKHMRFIRSKINTTERNHFLLPDALLLSTRCGIILRARARVLFKAGEERDTFFPRERADRRFDVKVFRLIFYFFDNM